MGFRATTFGKWLRPLVVAAIGGGFASCSEPRSAEQIGTLREALSSVITFQNGASGYTGMVDTRISQSSSTSNYGTSTSIEADGDTSRGRDLYTLLRWDISSIATGTTIEAVSITFNVTSASVNSYSLFALKRDWSESSATWQRAATGVNWQTSGAQGANDRDPTALGSISASALGSHTVELNAAAIAKIQEWVNDPSKNFGLIVANTTNPDNLRFASSEVTTLGSQPTLTVTHALPPSPDEDPPPDEEPAPVVLFATGDIGDCNTTTDTATGLLLDGSSHPIAALGDIVYPNGSASDFTNCFDPPWGRHKARIKPVPGNHEYQTSGASGYFGYFGAAAGDPTKGYYSYDLGEWHVVTLNSNCGSVSGGCGAGGAQEQWLRQDLAANPRACTLAYWHHPRYSSGEHGNSSSVTALWQALMDFGADVALVGHDHNYERWAAQDASGNASANGVVEFVVGTGGTALRPFPGSQPANSLARNASTHGVLELTLRADAYDWRFIPVAGGSFADQGSTNCH